MFKHSLENLNLFENFYMHAHKISFALAMRDLNCDVNLLNVSWNYPVHPNFPPVEIAPNVSPRMMHYHRNFTSELKIINTGIPKLDLKIGEFNLFISEKLLKNDVGLHLLKNMAMKIEKCNLQY